jgi:GTP-binding protein
LGYALFNLQERGRLFIGHGKEVYEGMIIGIHSRSNDLVVNPLKAKQLTNIRAAGSDENILLTPPIPFSRSHAGQRNACTGRSASSLTQNKF